MKYDLPQTTQFRTDAARYEALITKNARTTGEDVELAALAVTLEPYMIKATDFNNKADANFGTSTNSGNNYVLTLSPVPTSLTDGFPVSVKINVSNTGTASLNVNGLGAKPIKKSSGNDVASGNLKAASIYSLKYNITTGNFILQGEGGDYGTAVAADVLAGKTLGTDSGIISGIMVDRGTINYTPSQSAQTIAAGKHSGSGVVSAVTVPVANVLTGTSIAGANGTMPNLAGDSAALASSVVGTTLKLRSPMGFKDGIDDNVTITDADYIATNVRLGKDIFGLLGTLVEGAREATGTVTTKTGSATATASNDAVSTVDYLQVTGLAFTPSVVYIKAYTVTQSNAFFTVYFRNKTYDSNQSKIHVSGSSQMGLALYRATGNFEPIDNGFKIILPAFGPWEWTAIG